MPDALFGKTWKSDVNKSVFSTSFRPSSESRLYEERPNGYKLTVSGEHEGKQYKWHYEAYHDGKKHPVHGRDDVDAIEIYRVNDRITLGFFTKNDATVAAYQRVLSVDGKSL